jgi:DNA end-binding protein Ku
MWRGAIAFGLVTIPVRLYAATEEHDFRFHQVHRTDGGRIQYKRVCTACGKEVEFADIAKGYELEDGRMVLLDDKDFEALPITTDRAIDVLQFVNAGEVDPIFFQKSYYLEPDKAAIRPYVLLREALEQSGRVAIVKIAVRQRETLAMLRARQDVLVLHTMLWPDEIRKPSFGFLDQEVTVRPQEVQMATSLVESMVGPFTPEQLRDDYRDALQALIEAKAEGAELPKKPKRRAEGEVIDLMTALQRSVEQAQASREGAPRKRAGSTRTSSKARSAKTTAAAETTAAETTTKKAASARSNSTAQGSTSSTGGARGGRRTTARTGKRHSA